MSVPTAEDVRLLVRLLRRDIEGIERCLRMRSASLDRLAEMAVVHGLSVVLLRAIEHVPIDAAVSRTHLDAMQERRLRHERRSRILFEALATLADQFAAANQPFIILKGPYLAARFYGDVKGREFFDLDLLVPSADRARTVRLLAAASYSRRSRVLFGEGFTSFFVHGFDFSAGDAYLDLHWRLSRHPSLRLDEAEIWKRRRSYPIDGRSYAVLSDEHEVVFAALSLLRDLGAGKAKLIKVLDLIQIVAATDATIDWDALLEGGRRNGTYGPMVNILTLYLEAADAHDLAPRLTGALARHTDRRVPVHPIDSPLYFRPVHFSLGNRLWSARAYDTTLTRWFLWWAASLPFRQAVYRWWRP